LSFSINFNFMFSYRALLRQAWKIAWNHKYLWFFGLFASLTIAGGSTEYQVLHQNLQSNLIDGTYNYLAGLLALSDLLKNFWLGFIGLFQQNILVIINVLSLILITLALLFVFIWLAVCSQGALVADVKKIISAKKKPENLSIRDGLTTGCRRFWPLLGLNVLIKILINFTFFIISLPLLFLVIKDMYILVAIYTLLFVIFLPVAVSLSLIFKYAIVATVLEKKTAVVSLEQGWKLFKKSWLISLEMAIILFLITFFIGIGTLIILSFIVFPLFLIGVIYQALWLSVIMLIIALAVIILVGSFLTTFQTASWTELYLVLKENGGLAKLERIFRRRA